MRLQEPEQVRDTLARLSPVLAGDVGPLLDLPDEELLAQARCLTKKLRARRRAQNQADARRRAEAQVERLRSTASPYHGGLTVLGPAELLHSDLVRAPGMKFLELKTPDFQVVVRLEVLRRARPLLVPKPDLTAYLDAEGLHLRWNLGRGGLDLRYERGLTTHERGRVLEVTFARARSRPAGAWLGDVLADFGLVS